MFVYLITNSATGKIYVGQHKGNNLKKYVCEHCGHTDHRDANAAFNIAKRGAEFLSMGGTHDSERVSGAVLVTPYSGDSILCQA